MYYERQRYFKSMWNLFDCLLIVTYSTYIPFTLMFESTHYVIKSLQCLIVMFTFIKMMFYLRIYDEFSFLVHMMSSVFKDLKSFMLFFALFISTFAVFLSIVIRPDALASDYHQLGVLSYFVMAFRSSVGDNDMGNY